MASDGSLSTDPLFVGLTRPQLWLGVPIMYVMLNGLVSILYFIQTSDFKVIFFTVVIHMVGYIISFHEPRFIEIYQVKMKKCNKCPNRFFHGANSYDLY